MGLHKAVVTSMESFPIYIEVLTSENCPHSPKALKVAKKIAKKKFEMPLELFEVSIETEEGQTKAMEYEIEATPTIAINGRIVYVGIPTEELMTQAIKRAVEREHYATSYFF